MSRRRFMIDSRCIDGGTATLGGELHRHIARVLRLAPGESLILVDEKGTEHRGEVGQIGRDTLTVRITEPAFAAPPEVSGFRITLCQALPKGEKIDLILQKGTELGAHEFWLFGGRRSVARVSDDQRAGKLERWGRIAAEAARQCGRRTIPAVRWFPSALEAAAAAGQEQRLILWEGERTQRLKDTLDGISPPASVIVAIGPEGGFDPQETGQFLAHGFRSVSLGRRILRTETASIAIMAILQYIGDDA